MKNEDVFKVAKDELVFKSKEELLEIRKNVVKQIQVLEQQIRILLQQLASLKSTRDAIDELEKNWKR
ncbi:MAG: hypothetical protein QXU20_03815 [Candidatus Woesearchaeota archaeon]